MKLLETYVFISAKDEALKAGLKSASKYARREVSDMQKMFDSLSFGKFLNPRTLIAGAATVYGLKYSLDKLIGTTLTAGDEFTGMSKRTGISIESLSALSYVAKVTETDISAVEKSLKYLSNAMFDVSRGIGASKKTFAEMGISVLDAGGNLRSTVDVMLEAADVISEMTNETKKAAYASDLFGARTGTQLLPILKMGSAAIRSMMEEARRLGIVMSTEDAAAADEMGDNLETLKQVIEGLKRAIAMGIIPTLSQWVKSATEWIVINRELIRLTVSEWIVKVRDALEGLWKHRETIKNVFAISLIIIATKKLILLAGAVSMIANAMILLGTSKGLDILIKFLSTSAVGTALTVLASPGGLAVLGTLAAGGAIAYGIKEIRDNLKEIDSLKLSGASKFVEAAGGAPGQPKPGGMILTMGGYKSVPAAPPPREGNIIPPVDFAKLAADEIKYQQDRQKENLAFAEQGRKDELKQADASYAIEKEFSDRKLELEKQRRKESENLALQALKSAEENYIKNEELVKKTQDDSLKFSEYWADTLLSVVEQSGNSFDNIVRMFDQMIKKMMVKAAVMGFINLITGGIGGFGAGFAAAFKVPGLASGGDFAANRPIMVGERGPEIIIPKMAGTVIPNGAITTDNSRWELHFHDTAQERAAITGLDDEAFSRQFKRCLRDEKIKIKKVG